MCIKIKINWWQNQYTNIYIIMKNMAISSYCKCAPQSGLLCIYNLGLIASQK